MASGRELDGLSETKWVAPKECPRCRVELETKHYTKMDVIRCPKCDSYWQKPR